MLRLVIALSLAVVLAAETNWPTGAAERRATVVKGYSSPGEAFEAFRRARDAADWRAVLLCLPESSRDGEIVATFDNCSFSLDPKVAAVLQKYGLAPARVWQLYRKKYQEKHGVDLDRLQAEVRQGTAEGAEDQARAAKGRSEQRGSMPAPVPTLPPVDETVLREAVVAMVTDRVAFYDEANKVLFPQNAGAARATLGTLTNLAVSGDTASAQVLVTRHYLRSMPNGAFGVHNQKPVSEQLYFLRVDGRWFLAGFPCR
jgi:hypothetical protein